MIKPLFENYIRFFKIKRSAIFDFSQDFSEIGFTIFMPDSLLFNLKTF